MCGAPSICVTITCTAPFKFYMILDMFKNPVVTFKLLPSGKLYIHFVSDAGTVLRGFRGSFNVTICPNNCTGTHGRYSIYYLTRL